MKAWEGRFEKRASEALERFTAADDIALDERLIRYDILGSEAHALMLAKQGIIAHGELKKILSGLEYAKKLDSEGKLRLDAKYEDVHLNVERFITEKYGGEAGGKLHTGRSRNDQVALDTRMYMRDEILEVVSLLLQLNSVLLTLAKKHALAAMPGYTHTQHAQPITFVYWCVAHSRAFFRDAERLLEAYKRVNKCPLGAAALAGTSYDTDREYVADLLGFAEVQQCALDAVSMRGELEAEVLADFSITATHLSRLSEEILLFSTYEFGMLELSDAYATGSSIMPQKKNADSAELTRAKAAKIIGALVQVLATIKALPSGYNRDTQETKGALFAATDALKSMLAINAAMLKTAKINEKRMLALCNANFSCATDLADYLVQKHGVAFRTAHRITGSVVKQALREGRSMAEITPEMVKAAAKKEGVSISISASELASISNPLESIKRKKSLGSCNPEETERMRVQGERKSAELAADAEVLKKTVARAYAALEKKVAKAIS